MHLAPAALGTAPRLLTERKHATALILGGPRRDTSRDTSGAMAGTPAETLPRHRPEHIPAGTPQGGRIQAGTPVVPQMAHRGHSRDRGRDTGRDSGRKTGRETRGATAETGGHSEHTGPDLWLCRSRVRGLRVGGADPDPDIISNLTQGALQQPHPCTAHPCTALPRHPSSLGPAMRPTS